jgi:putative ABC transport system substrate-binding protein
MGISLIGPPLEAPIHEAEYRRVFTAMAQERTEALMVGYQEENLANNRVIIELADEGRLLAIYPFRSSAGLGGLMAYAVDVVELGRHAANEIGQILGGAGPGDIPYYQPTRLELSINLKTAGTCRRRAAGQPSKACASTPPATR